MTVANPKKLVLDALWRARTSKFGDFAGYDMPLQFEGLIPEHNWTRAHAGLFDVSHMGPCFIGLPKDHGLAPEAAHAAIAAQVERIVPSDIAGLKPGQIRYTTLLNALGGVLDDLMIARPSEPEAQGDLYVVVNAGCKENDWAYMARSFDPSIRIVRADDRCLLALQGPETATVFAALCPAAAEMSFMTYARLEVGSFGRLTISRSGYTGEDGYEILVKADQARGLADALLADERVKPIGLGARDSLRLEAGLCLYGHELDPGTSPIEADLAWIIQKRRREARDFPGATHIMGHLAEGAPKKRVGLRPQSAAPARDGVEIHKNGRMIGMVSSGGFSPTLNAPISMGYVETAFSGVGETVDLMVRGQARSAEIVALPFVPHRYHRSKGKA
jgi:aminomethyltransferase